MTKRVNKNSKKETTAKVANEATVKTNAIADKLKSINYSKSNAIVKAISLIVFTFAAIRTHILALAANEASIKLYTSDERVKLLRRSKKDSDLYRVLCSLSAFNYKAVTQKDANKVTTINYRKAYSIKSMLNACDVHIQISSVELTNSLIRSIELEHERKAVFNCSEAIKKQQNVCNVLMSTIEHLDDKQLIADYKEQLTKAEQQLTNKVALHEYVKLQSNRANIK